MLRKLILDLHSTKSLKRTNIWCLWITAGVKAEIWGLWGPCSEIYASPTRLNQFVYRCQMYNTKRDDAQKYCVLISDEHTCLILEKGFLRKNIVTQN